MMQPISGFAIVRSGEVYRGSQPYAPAQWDYIRHLGIRTILKLNYDDEGSDQGAVEAGLAVIKVPMPPRDVWQAIGRPDSLDVARAVEVLGAIKPIYVHCFPSGTMIGADIPVSIEASPKEVIGHDGKLHAVAEYMERFYEGPMYSIKARGLLPIECTPEHPFLVVRPYSYPNGGALIKPLASMLKNPNRWDHLRTWFAAWPQWMPAKELRLGDLLVTPQVLLDDSRQHPPILSSGHPNNLPVNTPEIDNDMAWLYGLYIADGATLGENGIGLTLGRRKNWERAALLMQRFGIRPEVKEEVEYVRIRLNSRALSRTFADWFGGTSQTKRIPSFLMRADIAQSLLDGIRAGDGSVWGSKKQGHAIYTTSQTLLYQIRQLLLFLGEYPMMGVFPRHSGYANASPMWQIRWCDSGQHIACWFGTPQGNYYCQPISNMSIRDYAGSVYNLSVDEANSYLANGVAVHNCLHGHDRTGLVIGEWRVLHCQWPPEQAYQEMREYGFHVELLDLDWTWHQFVDGLNR